MPGTSVDNVIVQKKDEAENEKNTYYLDKDFSHQKFRAGTVFMDYRDVFGYKEDEFSENLVLYGHNMADNTMFGSLRRYRQDLEFYKDAPFIKLRSNYKEYEYVIFGLVITSGDADNGGDNYADPMTWTGFPYWNMEELDDKTHFDYYVNTIESLNMIDNVVDVKYGDQLLTLSTCYSDEDNSRFRGNFFRKQGTFKHDCFYFEKNQRRFVRWSCIVLCSLGCTASNGSRNR